jgi:hypothetical protein
MAPCPWAGQAPATIAFCEERLCAWVVEPSNAWSNAAYVTAGVAVMMLARRRAPLLLLGLSGVLIGFGSFAFHATGTRWGELTDVGAMYLISGLAALFAARRIWPMSSTTLAAAFAALVAASVGLMVALHSNGILMFAGQIAFALVAEIYLFRAGRRVPTYNAQKWMLGSFGAAFVMLNLDKWDVLCAPTNHLITGHAVWHVLTAVALYAFARQQAQLIEVAVTGAVAGAGRGL